MTHSDPPPIVTTTRLEVAEHLVRRAGALVMGYFGAQFANIGGHLKDDGSPVTLADQQAEALIRQGLQQAFPEDTIRGEEEEDIIGLSGGSWIIDPIDGTKSFISHNPLFGTLLGYHDGGRMHFGLAYLPALDQLWCAEADGQTTCNGTPVQCATTVDLSGAVISTTSPDLFDAQALARWNALGAQVLRRQYGGDCAQYLFLASGGIDMVYEEGLKLYDILPLVPIIEAAGGRITDRDGQALTGVGDDFDGSCLAAANPMLHQQALDVIRSIR